MGNGFKSKAELKDQEKHDFEAYNESRRARGLDMLDPPKDESLQDEKKV